MEAGKFAPRSTIFLSGAGSYLATVPLFCRLFKSTNHLGIIRFILKADLLMRVLPEIIQGAVLALHPVVSLHYPAI